MRASFMWGAVYYVALCLSLLYLYRPSWLALICSFPRLKFRQLTICRKRPGKESLWYVLSLHVLGESCAMIICCSSQRRLVYLYYRHRGNTARMQLTGGGVTFTVAIMATLCVLCWLCLWCCRWRSVNTACVGNRWSPLFCGEYVTNVLILYGALVGSKYISIATWYFAFYDTGETNLPVNCIINPQCNYWCSISLLLYINILDIICVNSEHREIFKLWVFQLPHLTMLGRQFLSEDKYKLFYYLSDFSWFFSYFFKLANSSFTIFIQFISLCFYERWWYFFTRNVSYNNWKSSNFSNNTFQ